MAKAIILLGTVKKTEPSNTELLSTFLAERMRKKNIEVEIIKLVEKNILPGTYSDMGEGDAWPEILQKLIASEIIIFATPVWWGIHSSEIQKVIERLDELHDEIMEGKTSRLENKVGGIIITGDGDGAEHIIGNIANFFNAIGILLPPYATLSVLSAKHSKDKKTPREELLAKYEKEYGNTADKMIEQLEKYL